MSEPTPKEKIQADPDPEALDHTDAVSDSIDTVEGASQEAPSAETSPEKVALAEAEEARDQYKDALQRLQADFENYRKRTQKEMIEGAERANGTLVTKLLGVLDTIDMAKAHEPSGSIEQVSVALLEALNKEGLERIVAVDAPFDPNLHEAVVHEPGEGEPTVSEELRAGYSWKGRVLRPSMVKVTG